VDGPHLDGQRPARLEETEYNSPFKFLPRGYLFTELERELTQGAHLVLLLPLNMKNALKKQIQPSRCFCGLFFQVVVPCETPFKTGGSPFKIFCFVGIQVLLGAGANKAPWGHVDSY
jgi:hypothetical protein